MENIDKRINLLIKQGYTQAAFDNRVNAEKFARKWKEKGYKIIGFLSSGPSVENPKKRSIHAYYVIADKPKLPRINLKSHVNTPKPRKVKAPRLGSMRRIKVGSKTGYTRRRK